MERIFQLFQKFFWPSKVSIFSFVYFPSFDSFAKLIHANAKTCEHWTLYTIQVNVTTPRESQIKVKPETCSGEQMKFFRLNTQCFISTAAGGFGFNSILVNSIVVYGIGIKPFWILWPPWSLMLSSQPTLIEFNQFFDEIPFATVVIQSNNNLNLVSKFNF